MNADQMAEIARLISFLCWVMIILIFIRVAFSWFNRDLSNPLYRYSYQLTEPILRPVRNALPGGGMGGLDFSPMIVSFGLYFISALVSSIG